MFRWRHKERNLYMRPIIFNEWGNTTPLQISQGQQPNENFDAYPLEWGAMGDRNRWNKNLPTSKTPYQNLCGGYTNYGFGGQEDAYWTILEKYISSSAGFGFIRGPNWLTNLNIGPKQAFKQLGLNLKAKWNVELQPHMETPLEDRFAQWGISSCRALAKKYALVVHEWPEGVGLDLTKSKGTFFTLKWISITQGRLDREEERYRGER